MCRLFAITSDEPLSPMTAIQALDVMKEGHDGSGVGLLMSDLGGELEQFKGSPILSGIFTQEGIKRLDRYMMELGLLTKYKMSIRPNTTPPRGTPRRDVYLIRVYEYPYEWEGLSQDEIEQRLLAIRLDLRRMGEDDGSMMVFSFWPDTIMIKEVGDPMAVAGYLGLDRQ
ncbi:MAG TPA: glutamate synthase, partial [Deltaproteobacteria bacterium]|nr:glutamate synthase [Deltaproteobacteria bacterium]